MCEQTNTHEWIYRYIRVSTDNDKSKIVMVVMVVNGSENNWSGGGGGGGMQKKQLNFTRKII